MNLKKIVGYEAVEWVKDGYVIGLGTGYYSLFHRKAGREDKK